MTFPRLRFSVLVISSCAAFAIACGGISDPTKDGSGEKVATVSGALTGSTIPANARVALVWRTATSDPTQGGYAVGDDVAVVDGKFSISLGVPAAAYFSNIDGSDSNFGSSGGSDQPPTVSEPATPVPASGGAGGAKIPSATPRISPRDVVSGGITSPLSGAVAGFVVYVDSNNNGKLDLAGTYAASTDQILGGNKELVLTYLKDGGQLDYEKLRDTSGILPTEGFNLAWTVGKRWMPLNVVELKLDAKQGLPSPVCSSSGEYGSGGSAGGTGGFDPVATPPVPQPVPDVDAGIAPTPSEDGGFPVMSYPSPTDPNLVCSPDGRSWTYSPPSTCAPPVPAPVGLCAGDATNIAVPCASGGYGDALASGAPIPEGWPCVTAPTEDGGSSADASVPPSADGGK